MRSMKTLLLLLCLAGSALAQNRVLELDGEGSYVHLPGGLFDSLEEATVEAWVKWEDWAYFSQWFAFGGDEQWQAMGMNHWYNSSDLQFFLYTSREELHVLRLGTALPLGQWCHMAAVSGRGGMRFYFNGVLVGQNSFEGSFADLGSSSDNYLGKSSWRDNAYFRGQLDEVRVWSVARSREQIRAAMAQRLRGDEAGLMALWNFDAGDARDDSPRGHAGQLLGGARCVAAPFPGMEGGRSCVVQGTVRDETGVPLVNAVVRLRQAEAEVASVKTRADGRYALAVFEAGEYVLEADLEEAGLQWADPRGPGPQRTPLHQEVLLQEGEHLLLDLSTPSSRVAAWSGEGHARDEVGLHHGARIGGAGFAPGLVGQAFHLDGEDDVVRVPHDPGLNLSGSFSLVAWVFPTVDKQQKIIEKWAYRPPQHDGEREYYLALEPGLRLLFGISDDVHQLESHFHDFFSLPGVVVRNAWNQVAAVYDQETGTRQIYANGVEVARRRDAPTTLTRGDVVLHLGRFFKGAIDEVSIYRRALADAAIQRLYGARTEARWSGEGQAEDSRGANHGTLVNGVAFAPGLVGQAFSFDGQGSHIEFNPLIGNFGTADFTIELWVCRPRTPTSAEPLLVKHFDNKYIPNGRYLEIMGNEAENALDLHLDATGRVQAELNSGYDFSRVSSTGPLALQQWHHLALVRQGREVRLYLDGELDAQNATDRVVDLNMPAPLTLGGAPAQERYFHGFIDEVAFHNRALSTDAIQHTYETTLNAWRWRLWRGWLEKGGIGLAVLLALLSSGRYYTQRKARQQREAQLAEAHRAREEAHRARQLADAANKAKSAFLANMSHEIRTPMNAILGYAQILRGQTVLPPEQQQRAVEAIYTSGDHLLKLINNVLDLSKIEAGRMEVQEVDFDLAQLVEELDTMFQVRCQQQGLSWHVEQEGEHWQVRGDENKLRQVLVNLLGNAVKFTGEGDVTLQVRAAEGMYHFAVQDTGPGIDLKQQDAMFNPFQQGR
jgi:signal transduction histidine kinase